MYNGIDAITRYGVWFRLMARKSELFLRPDTVHVTIRPLKKRGSLGRVIAEVNRVVREGEQLRRGVRRTPDMIRLQPHLRLMFYKFLDRAESRL